MRFLRNEDGIALITALMFTLVCLGMIMTLLYYVLAGTRMSAAHKSYRNTLEASYGGTEFITKTVIPRLFNNYSTNKIPFLSEFSSSNTFLSASFPSGNLGTKLNKPTVLWGGASTTVDPKDAPDMAFVLKGNTSAGDFNVYGKIVDTVPSVGLIDTSGVDYLDAGSGVSGTSSSTATPRTPTIYSIEVQSERAANPKEKAALSVLYAY